MERPYDTKNKEQNHPRKLLTSYGYPGYPRADLCIYSSFEQPYLSFNGDTNSFFGPAQGDDEPALSKTRVQPPGVIVYFVPGNPGLIEFYDEFFLDLCESFHHLGGCEVVSSGHLGHSLRYNSNLDLRFLQNFRFWNNDTTSTGAAHLSDQIAYHSRVVQNLLDHAPSQTKLVIIGHSVGAYIATKILEKHPDRVMHIIGLFPTISHIGRSKNGRLLAPLFSPILLPFINLVQIIACVILPKVLVCSLITLLFRPNRSTSQHPHEKKAKDQNKISRETGLLLLDFVRNINSVSAVLKMARSEMQDIRELDAPFIRRFHDQVTFFWTSPAGDEWVDECAVDEILQTLKSESPEEEKEELSFNAVPTTGFHQKDSNNLACSSAQNEPTFSDVPCWKRMEAGIPHAFCLSKF